MSRSPESVGSKHEHPIIASGLGVLAGLTLFASLQVEIGPADCVDTGTQNDTFDLNAAECGKDLFDLELDK
jgi:hypothetical protein